LIHKDYVSKDGMSVNIFWRVLFFFKIKNKKK